MFDLNDELLTPEQVAAETKVAKATLAEWRVRGGTATPPFVKMGKRVLYPRSKLRAWLAERMHDSTVVKRALPETGFVRLSSILAPRGPISVSKATWWNGIKKGRFPKPVKLGPRMTAWRVEDIRRLIENDAAAASGIRQQRRISVDKS